LIGGDLVFGVNKSTLAGLATGRLAGSAAILRSGLLGPLVG
jgi:thiamine monophosphate kinase